MSYTYYALWFSALFRLIIYCFCCCCWCCYCRQCWKNQKWKTNPILRVLDKWSFTYAQISKKMLIKAWKCSPNYPDVSGHRLDEWNNVKIEGNSWKEEKWSYCTLVEFVFSHSTFCLNTNTHAIQTTHHMEHMSNFV